MDLKSKVLVIKDYYSRYLITKLVNSENCKECLSALEVFLASLENLTPLAPLAPRQNGMVERAMQGIKKALTAAKIENRNLTQTLKEYVDSYNSWPHAVTLIPSQ